MASPQKRKQSRIKRAVGSVDPDGIDATKEVFGLAVGMVQGLMGMFARDPRLAPDHVPDQDTPTETPTDETPPNSENTERTRQKGRRRRRRKTRPE